MIIIQKRDGALKMNGVFFICSILLSMLLLSTVASATQTCRSDLNVSTPVARFISNSDGTVTDTSTKLTWKRCPEGLLGNNCETGKAITYTWAEAEKWGTSSLYAGKKWRVPTIQELNSIIEYRCTMPSINSEIFPATPTSNFWTSSHFAGYPAGGWNINFNDGSHETCNKNWNLYLRLVYGSATKSETKLKGECR